MKNLKYLISSITALIVVIIALSLIYIHNLVWVKANSEDVVKEMQVEVESFVEYKNYNTVLQSNVILLITYADDIQLVDSINKQINNCIIEQDSIFINSRQYSDNKENLTFYTKSDSLSKLRKEIVELIYQDNIENANQIFVEAYNPLFFEINEICDSIEHDAFAQIVILESNSQKTKSYLMWFTITMIGFLTTSFLIIIILLNKFDKRRFSQQKELDELNIKNKYILESSIKEKRLQAAIQTAGFGVIDWDFKLDKPEVSDKWLEVYGISREEFDENGVQSALEKIIDKVVGTSEEMQKKISSSLKTRFDNEFQIQHKDGFRWIQSFDFVIEKDKDGKPVHIFGFVNDITERKEAEIKIIESQRILKSSGRTGKIGYWEFDVKNPKPRVSDEWLELFSISKSRYEEGEYADWIQNMKEEYREIAIKNHSEIISGVRTSFCSEYVYNHPEKGEIWIEGFGEVCEYDRNGRVSKYIGYHQDISRRKSQELESQKISEELKLWYKNMNISFCVCEQIVNKNESTDFKYLFVNEEFCNTINLSENDILNKTAGSFLHFSSRQIIIANLQDVFTKGSVRFEVYDAFLSKHFEIYAFKISEKRFAMLYFNITARYQLQEKLSHEQKYYRQLFELSQDAIFIIDPDDMHFIDANESCVHLFGALKKEDLLAVKYSMLYPSKQINGESSSVLLKLALRNIDKRGEENYDWIFRKITGQEFIGQIKFTKISYNHKDAFLGLVRDVTLVYNTHENLEKTRQWLQTIIDSLTSVIVVKDNYGNILASNHSFNKTFGQDKESIIGKKAVGIYTKDEAKSIEAIDDEIVYLGISRTYEQKLTTADNIEHIFLITKTPLKDSKGNVYAVVGQGTDITNMKSLEWKLRDAQNKAVVANRSKSSFLANMSHEIRTPMNAIIGFAEILQKKLISPEHKDYVNSIYTAGNTLLNLINDILDFSKIEAGKIELRPVFCDPESLKKEIKEIFNLKAEEKNLAFDVEYNKCGEFLFFMDENRLRQILINIVGNAIKFTNSGYVHVIISCDDPKNNNSNLIFTVEDSGIGIASEELLDIFNPFIQSENIDSNDTGGTGLGLSICNQLVKLMNGSIKVESELGKGTKFIISFEDVPYENTQMGLGVKEQINTEYIFKPANILIVDDIKSNRDVLSVHLTDYNFTVEQASSGIAAIDMASRNKYDLIIMDLRMPDINGIEAAKSIKNSENNSQIKIIAYTAAVNFALIDGNLNPLFDGLIIKPAIKSSITRELIKILDYEEVTAKMISANVLFNFNTESISFIKETLSKIVNDADSRLTNRQIAELIKYLRQSEVFEKDEDLQNFVHSLSKAVEEFNVVLIEHLTGILLLTNKN
jgi:PAS domain S-box-containing protein